MDKKTLEAAKQESADQFDVLMVEKQAITVRLAEIEQELLRLQGDFRTYSKLLDEDKPKAEKTASEK